MNERKCIDVGIRTSGEPVIERERGYTILKNLLIGDGFHWQQTIEAKLPGELIPFLDENDPHIRLINRLPLETYLECVVGSEMNPDAPIEFLKAHAVISRSWVVGKILGSHNYGPEGKMDSPDCIIGWDDTASHTGFHVCSDDHCQRYQGIQEIAEKSSKAIRETTGEVLKDSQGLVIDARFSKCCGGKTEIFETCWQPLSVNCLESFEDPWCNLSMLPSEDREKLLNSVLKSYDKLTEDYGYRWTTEITKKEIKENLLNRFGRNIGDIKSIEILHRGPSGRIDLLNLSGSNGTLKIGKELWIRRLLSASHLYSSAFEIHDKGDKLILTGIGWGHGVGLCQIGAANMAASGHDYRSILSFYYPGSKIEKL